MVELELNNELHNFLSDFKINSQIINTFINRKIPENNLYWQYQNTYLDFKIRFLAIPFWFEICHRKNIVPLDVLLDESNLHLMEQILNFSEEEELEIINYSQCFNKCSDLDKIQYILKSNAELRVSLERFLENNPKHKSLRRGNFLVFYNIYLCENNLDNLFKLSHLLIDLLICGCVIDDLHDVSEDRISKEDNIIIELGDNMASINEVKEIFENSSKNLYKIFPELKSYMEDIFAKSVFKFLSQT